MLLHVDALDADAHLVADPVNLRRPLADQRHMLLMEMIIVIRQLAEPDQAFHRVPELDEHAEARDAADDAVELLADLVEHELAFLELLRVPLRLDRDALALGRLPGDVRQFRRQLVDPLRGERSAARQHLADDPVNDEVRIPPDRRREVRIELRRQPEVPEAVRLVPRLLHRAQHHRRDDRLFLRAADRFEQILQRARMHLVPFALHDIAEIRHEPDEVQQLLRVRIFVDPVQERHLQPIEMLRHRLVRRQHELLDDHLGDRALALHDIDRLAVLVDDDLRLLEVEVDGAALHPLVAQLQRQLLHQLEHVDEARVPLLQLGIVVDQYFAHIRVGHPLRRPNDARENIMPHHPQRLFIELHLARQRQPVDLRVERTDSVRQPVRQHRNDPVDEIDAGAAAVGLLVERRIFLHIIPDIRDMDPEQIIAVRQSLDAHRVVQVLRVLAVDRDDRLWSQIAPALRGNLFLGDPVRHRLGLGHHLVREPFRKLMLADDRQNIDAGIVLVAENFDDLARRRRASFGIRHDAGDDLLPRHRAVEPFLRDEQVAVDPFVIRDDEAERFVMLERADDLRDRPLHDAHDFAFQAAARAAPRAALRRHARQHDVAVHRAFQIVRVNVDVRMIRLVRDQEREPFRMRLHPPAQQIHPLRHAVAVVAGPVDFPFFFQFVQQLEERLEFLRALQPERLLQFLYGHRLVRQFPHEIKQLFFRYQLRFTSCLAGPL